jgi:hypothetical protein
LKRKLIKLKRSTTNIEKRKIIIKNEENELNKKLDTMINKDKQVFKMGRFDFKKKAYQTARTGRAGNVKKETGQVENKTSLENIFQKNMSPVKPKFKNYGQCKVLVIPHELKKKLEIYDDSNVIKDKNLKNSIKNLIEDKLTNIKSKKYIENISIPKTKKGQNKSSSKFYEAMKLKCEKLETNNIKIMNDIKRTNKKFDNGSLFLDPKSAFLMPNEL